MTTLGDVITIEKDAQTADFWIQCKGVSGASELGRPSSTKEPGFLGVTVTDHTRVVPKYLYYLFEHLANENYFDRVANGTGRILHLTAADVLAITITEAK